MDKVELLKRIKELGQKHGKLALGILIASAILAGTVVLSDTLNSGTFDELDEGYLDETGTVVCSEFEIEKNDAIKCVDSDIGTISYIVSSDYDNPGVYSEPVKAIKRVKTTPEPETTLKLELK